MKIVRKIKEFHEWYLNQPPIYDRHPYFPITISVIALLVSILKPILEEMIL